MKLVDKQKMFFLVVFAGFVAGILYTNLFAVEYMKLTGVFSSYYLQEFVNREILVSEYFWQVLKVRLIPAIALVMLASSRVNKIGVVLFLLWTGFLWGIFMTLGVAQLNIYGIILCVVSVLPQMIFYVPAYIILLIFTYKFPTGDGHAIKLGVVILCLISGIVLECSVSPQILKWFITLS